ncbi:hypothetical protein Zm00014a_020253 [Zea mays]|uniref:Uncharacterized protein n=1 Tax=Zea mays TaxID=4577 RepID=A0A3L6FBW0_MAIZE|nr:hypothetical protein Zm00014a_020253 [Zea mays]
MGVPLCGCRCKHLIHADSTAGTQLRYFFILCGRAWHLISTCETIHLPGINKNLHVLTTCIALHRTHIKFVLVNALIKLLIRARTSKPTLCIAFV